MGSAPPPAADQLHSHSLSPSLPPANVTPGIMGKHRMTAAIAFLNQQIQILQDEIDELDNIGGVSTVCPELIASVDPVPDALLPVTRGPADACWDRWFQGANTSKSRRRWI